MPRWLYPLQDRDSLAWMRTSPAGQFGAARKFDRHTGVDLYCHEHATVAAVESGVVVAVEDFTGPSAGSPWWMPTQAVLVAGRSGVVVYGEIQPDVCAGCTVRAGQRVGTVLRVPRKSKGATPTSMLHLELLQHSARASAATWHVGDDCPAGLLDPTPHLLRALHVASQHADQ